jgi:putative transposase
MGRGHPPAPALKLTPRQYRVLSTYHRKNSIPYRNKVRISILLGGYQGQPNKQLARELGISLNKVKHWRGRWQSSYEELLVYEQGEDGEGVKDHELLKKMLSYLADAPRSGAPARITTPQKEQLVALACEKPSDYGVEQTHWNRDQLAEVVMRLGIMEKISPRYVSEILKK